MRRPTLRFAGGVAIFLLLFTFLGAATVGVSDQPSRPSDCTCGADCDCSGDSCDCPLPAPAVKKIPARFAAQRTVGSELQVQTEGKVGSLAVVSHDVRSKWSIYAPGGQRIAPYEDSSGTAVVFVLQKPGIYNVEAFSVDFDAKTFDQCVTQIFVEGEQSPDPTPGPGPQPGPGPTPTPGKRFLVVVYESQAKTPALGDLFLALRQSPAVASHQLIFTDKDSQAYPSYKALVPAGTALPYLVITDAAGKLCHQGPLPGTVAACEDVLKKAGG